MINNHFTPSVNELNDVDLGEHEEEDSGYEYIRMWFNWVEQENPENSSVTTSQRCKIEDNVSESA